MHVAGSLAVQVRNVPADFYSPIAAATCSTVTLSTCLHTRVLGFVNRSPQHPRARQPFAQPAGRESMEKRVEEKMDREEDKREEEEKAAGENKRVCQAKAGEEEEWRGKGAETLGWRAVGWRVFMEREGAVVGEEMGLEEVVLLC